MKASLPLYGAGSRAQSMNLMKGLKGPIDPLRSRIMRANKPTGCRSTELRLRMALIRARISGWRMNYAYLPGRPEFWFASERRAVFVDGDFWHGNPVGFRKPKTRRAFWCRKIEENRERDRRVGRCLRRMGIRVVRIWESDIRSDVQLGAVVCRLANQG